MSCLEEYQFDYFNEYPSNCVPEGYFNDKENEKLIKCDFLNSKFYTNSINNKKICFKYIYSCPENYPYLDDITHECKSPPTVITYEYKENISSSSYDSYNDIIINNKIVSTNINNSDIYSDLIENLLKSYPSDVNSVVINNSDIYSDLKENLLKFYSSDVNSVVIDDSDIYSDLKENLLKFYSSDENSVVINNSDIYRDLKENLLKSYSSDENSVVIKGEDNIVFQLTTTENELNILNGNYENEYNLSIIDLGDCETLLKNKYEIDEDSNLIILKSEQITNISAQKNVQYEIYNPNNKTEKLDISICSNTSINLYLPIILSEKSQRLYDDLNKYGYDLFNIKDKFYQDICTPYTTENKTDILLSDRKNDFYNPNETACQSNCEYSGYLSNLNLLKCECNIINEEIDYKNLKKFDGLSLFTSFYEILKYSNYKVLKCYNLVFILNVFTKNKGSIVVIVYFSLFFIFLCNYIIIGIKPLKLEISKFFFQKKKDKDIKKHNDEFNRQITKKQTLNESKIKITKRSSFKRKTKNSNIKTKKTTFRKLSSKNSLMTKKNSGPPKRNSKATTIKSININFNSINSFQFSEKLSISKKKVKEGKEAQLDDFKMNQLEYNEALKLDKRKFLRIYWSILKREHTILFLIYLNDYNLLSIKFARFFFFICTDMALNVFFFSDASMHKMYLDYGRYNFYQQIPQIVYSILISQLLQVFMCFLSFTDKHIYKIKGLKKMDKNQIFQILRCVKIKIFGFFTVTIIFFGFYWYLISTFCAVYVNTQMAFIKNSIFSFLINLLIPFGLYLVPSTLRIVSLKDTEKKRFKFVYNLSYIIPIF